MIYLIMKMSVYLAVALAAGFGSGWLTRNLTAAKQEDELQRALSETKARLPQFESLMRSRDQQMEALRDEVKQKDARIGALHEEMGKQDQALKEKERELKKVQNRVAAFDVVDGAAEPGAVSGAELSQEYDRLLKALDLEKRKVVELERERELQNKSLQVLHQQLELARESGNQAASG